MTTTETITVAATSAKLTPAQKAAKRVADLEIKLKQARAFAQKQSNKMRHTEQAVARKIETRKKVLIGAYVLEKHPEFSKSAEFSTWLTRDDERAIFGFEGAKNDDADAKEA